MSKFERLKATSKQLNEDIEEFKNRPGSISPYRLINGLSASMIEVGGLVSPHLKTAGIIIKVIGAFFKGYSNRKDNKIDKNK
jgi:hypothetical protein